MAPTIIGSILIDAALLGILIYLVARHNATNDLFNRVAVIAAATLGNLAVAALWAGALGGWVLAPQVALTAVLLIWLVGTNPVQAAIITALFFAIKIGLNAAWAYVLSGV